MQSWARLGIFSLPCSGILGTISVLLPGVFINPSIDPQGFAQASSSIGLGNLLGIVSLILWLVGIQALYSFLAGISISRLGTGCSDLLLGRDRVLPASSGNPSFRRACCGSSLLEWRHGCGGSRRRIHFNVERFGALIRRVVGSTLCRRLNYFRVRNLAMSNFTKMGGSHVCCCGNAFFLECSSLQFRCRPSGGLLLLISGGWISASITRRKRK